MVIRYDELLNVIQRWLAGHAQALLPGAAARFRIPLFDHEFILRPRAEEEL